MTTQHVDALFPRHTGTWTESSNLHWWTTSGGSTFLPSGSEEPATSTDGTSTSSAYTSDPTDSSTGAGGSGTLTTFTSSIPISTITQSSTTLTSFSDSVVSSYISNTISPSFTSSSGASNPTGRLNSANSIPVCAGDGLDASSDGILASVVFSSAVGLLIWLLFAILRPRFRQVYGLREWFLSQDLRPKSLGSGFFAFLHPPVPLVPDVPANVDDAGKSLKTDAELFPSDEQLSQRVIWISFLIVLGWSILALAGCLPLYLASTPCLADYSQAQYGGAYSTLQDLSLMRLLRMLDQGDVSIKNLLVTRADDSDDRYNVRPRIIVLTVLVIVLALLPALWKIIKEFNALVAYRQRWLNVKCDNEELAWLSVRDAPGFIGWGEKQIKDFIIKCGLSSTLDRRSGRHQSEKRRWDADAENTNMEVDIKSLFSIVDTHQLALLIEERDEILENLEIAETRYIKSFRISTPDPSIVDLQPQPPEPEGRPYISRPLPLRGSQRYRGARRRTTSNKALASSSLAPTSFVAPSQYYRLRKLSGISGGRFTDSPEGRRSFSDAVHSRVIGSQFHEIQPHSPDYHALPLGSHVGVDCNTGELGPLSSSSYDDIPDPRYFGPNHSMEEFGQLRGSQDYDPDERLDDIAELQEWVDLERERPGEYESSMNGATERGQTPRFSGTSSRFPRRARPRPPRQEETPSPARRETFPLRSRSVSDPEAVMPPHLRLQPSQPFVRPLEGVDYEGLGEVYNEIKRYRSQLKAINTEIAEAQTSCYNDIAEGVRIKGWLIVGKGLRFIPGMQQIEGRAKEDVRWDILQDERSTLDTIVLWVVVTMMAVTLAVAPGIATVLTPAIAAIAFISFALWAMHYAAKVQGSVSISGGQLLTFKITFFALTVVAGLFLITVGALIFALHAFSEGSGVASSVANGSIYIMVLCLALIINLAIIIPGLLLLQPTRLWRVLRAEKQAVTPRQRFRAVYPRTYNPSFATGACVLAIVFASTFSLIFPLIAPAVTLLLLLTLVAHRFLVGYVYGRTHSQTGGLLQIWLLRRFGTVVAFQPILLGLIYLSRELWIEGGILCGVGGAVILFMEGYASWKTRLPGRKSLSHVTQDSLDRFVEIARPKGRRNVDEESTSLVSGSRLGQRTRGSLASVLEMMSLTLAVMPSSAEVRGPVPLKTETLDDLTATERAARTHPDAPPHLPPLPFADHAEEMAGILYPPELIAPPPIIWLPNDAAGVARSEAVDLQKYHDLRVTLDVPTGLDVLWCVYGLASCRTSEYGRFTMDNGHVSGAPRAHATASAIIDANVEQGLRAGCLRWRTAGRWHLSELWKAGDISRSSCAH
ncbi:uncharacterized protein SCHCODRAFT_080873 [Schizophyllum commune H4-8]|uniref:CSC1/OSCA1-like 7TM region domain-containing protein n=1 Tax=Schizophyllum commune (strain H4-8 / FGSC 9210) TaxID=578458 RepID=D8PR81_SCHCM|nr:uncharacterized protein SCHCODRAFT_080873 [Schizophyllum commune H4-8]KAI5898056.1 hypothetical protein SCHCODRAFT_080873 [Schizophyllum commune H4-8]